MGVNDDKYGTRFPDMSFAYKVDKEGEILAGVNYPYSKDQNKDDFLKDNSFNLLSDGLIYDVIIANHSGLTCKANIIVV